MDLLLTGRLVTAEFAASIALINRVLPSADVMPAAVKAAIEIAANSPSAVQAGKKQIHAGLAHHAATQEALEKKVGGRRRASLHFAEGVAAFREKRNPRYD